MVSSKTNQFLRVLKPAGTFILNIKERVHKGERHTYVIELILSMRNQGWLWTEEFIWHKKNCYPCKWPYRLMDAWEHCLQFNKIKKFNMYQESVMIPVGNWAKKRLKNLSDADNTRVNSRVNSGFGKKISNWVGREFVYPTNVLHLATECANRGHSASFPITLPTWFIRLFTQNIRYIRITATYVTIRLMKTAERISTDIKVINYSDYIRNIRIFTY